MLTTKIYPDNTTALYARLSQEDAEDALDGSGKGQNGYCQGYIPHGAGLSKSWLLHREFLR